MERQIREEESKLKVLSNREWSGRVGKKEEAAESEARWQSKEELEVERMWGLGMKRGECVV